jgi:phosphatidylserine/phosphatidylglycerophosphate/cardiolipin synthase-like enzyme
MPRVLYDPLALTSGSGPRSCLHAKCLIVDDERALVTSANFTEAAMDRNIEAGVLVDDAGFAARLRAQFDALEQSGQVHSLPDMQPR